MYFPRVKQLRLDHEKTQQQLADILHCNRQVYARYENGYREFPVSMLIKIAEHYRVSLDYLVGNTDILVRYEKKVVHHTEAE